MFKTIVEIEGTYLKGRIRIGEADEETGIKPVVLRLDSLADTETLTIDQLRDLYNEVDKVGLKMAEIDTQENPVGIIEESE